MCDGQHPFLLGQWTKECHWPLCIIPQHHCSLTFPQGTVGVGPLCANHIPMNGPNLADIIASGCGDGSVAPPLPSPLPFGAACVCSRWHFITERTQAGGGPSGVNQIVTVERSGSSVRDGADRGAIQRTLPAGLALFNPPLDQVLQFSPRPDLLVSVVPRQWFVGDVQKKTSRAGVPGETASCSGHHDSLPPLFLPGVRGMKTA